MGIGVVVSISNSMQYAGLDFDALSSKVGVTVEPVGRNGPMSAYWMCELYKVAKRSYKPKVIMIIDRYNFITIPNMRIEAGSKNYGEMITECIDGDTKLNDLIRGVIGSRTSITYGGAAPTNIGSWDFNANVDNSFLPKMIEYTKAAGATFVFTWQKTSLYAFVPEEETESMKKYREDLAAYMQKNGARFLDYTTHPMLTKDHYKMENGERDDHMNLDGRNVWTGLMAEDLKAILAGKRAENEKLVRS